MLSGVPMRVIICLKRSVMLSRASTRLSITIFPMGAIQRRKIEIKVVVRTTNVEENMVQYGERFGSQKKLVPRAQFTLGGIKYTQPAISNTFCQWWPSPFPFPSPFSLFPFPFSFPFLLSLSFSLSLFPFLLSPFPFSFCFPFLLLLSLSPFPFSFPFLLSLFPFPFSFSTTHGTQG